MHQAGPLRHACSAIDMFQSPAACPVRVFRPPDLNKSRELEAPLGPTGFRYLYIENCSGPAMLAPGSTDFDPEGPDEPPIDWDWERSGFDAIAHCTQPRHSVAQRHHYSALKESDRAITPGLSDSRLRECWMLSARAADLS
jgi:hypothetical protein